jgi:transcriptional repressor NrdR
MNCPVCNYKDTKVIDSRITTDKTGIRRRRECLKCAFRFSTLEEVELLDILVVKRDGRRQPYSREKLVHGLHRSLEKRSFTEDKFYNLVHTIERDIHKSRKSELTTKELGEIVMKRLKPFDEVAYIRFASVYRQFKDAGSFQRELLAMMKKTKKHKSDR